MACTGRFCISCVAGLWLQPNLFGARAFMQMGVTIGTIMVANVLMIIIPGQKSCHRIKAGKTPIRAWCAR